MVIHLPWLWSKEPPPGLHQSRILLVSVKQESPVLRWDLPLPLWQCFSLVLRISYTVGNVASSGPSQGMDRVAGETNWTFRSTPRFLSPWNFGHLVRYIETPLCSSCHANCYMHISSLIFTIALWGIFIHFPHGELRHREVKWFGQDHTASKSERAMIVS